MAVAVLRLSLELVCGSDKEEFAAGGWIVSLMCTKYSLMGHCAGNMPTEIWKWTCEVSGNLK